MKTSPTLTNHRKTTPQKPEDRLGADTSTEFRVQLPRNLSMQVLSFVTRVVVGIWLVPYLIHHLGRAAYGLIPIAGMMTQYVSLISQSICSSTQRFLTIALQRNDADDGNRVFNTAFFSYLVLGLIQIPVFGLIINHANMLFSIPEELYRDAIVLLLCSAASFLINLACSVFAVPIYANNRLDISRSIDVGRVTARFAGIVVLFASLGPALRYVGYVDLVLTIALCAIQVRIGKRLAPVLKVAIRYYDWHQVRQLMEMGGWLLVTQLGALFFLQTDVWVCNRFVGAESAGDYAAVLQWSVLIRQAGSLIGSVVGPMVVICYARSEMDHMIRIGISAVRMLSLALALPISMMCVFSAPLLRIWLGDSSVRLAPLMMIMLCHLVVNVGVSPLFNINNATNRVRWPGLITLVGGVANLCIAILFVEYFGWGTYGVAAAGALMLTMKNVVFLPIYTASILCLPWHTFLRPLVSGGLLLVGLTTSGLVVSRWTCTAPVMGFAGMFVALTLTGLVTGWYLLPQRDRRLIASMVVPTVRYWVGRVISV